MRPVNEATISLIKSFEGMVLHPYLDAVGVPTIGCGTIRYPDGRRVSMHDPDISEEEALSYLKHDMESCQEKISELVSVPITDNQFGALVSFAYNLGIGALKSSTLLQMLNAKDYDGAADQFLRWDHAGGRRLTGLTKRRQAERALFLHPVNIAFSEGSPDVNRYLETSDFSKIFSP